MSERPAPDREPLPRISIVTPSLDPGPVLATALASVRDQGYPDCEHWVIDGGSTDKTAELVRGDPEVRWLSEPDRGQSDALNKGFRLATGAILGWLNADDALLPGALDRVAKAFRADPTPDLVVGACEVVDAADRLLWVARPGDVSRLDAGDNPIPQPATFFSRAIWERIGPLDESLTYAMDLDLWLRARRAGARFRVLDARLARFQIRPGQAIQHELDTALEHLRVYRHRGRGPRLQGSLRAAFRVAQAGVRTGLRRLGVNVGLAGATPGRRWSGGR